MSGAALILGGTGRFGRTAAEAFWNAGWRVRLFDRGHDDLMQAAQGADVIVNGWNPPYPQWQALVPQQTQQVIAAARASGATILLPGNVYVYGADAPARFAPDTPHGATNPLGQLRIRMEATYRAANLRVILLRGGDFLDTEASGNWFDKIIAPSLAKGALTWPGDPQAAHAWAYLPDMARAMVMLADRRDLLPRFTDITFPGYTLSGTQMAALAQKALHRKVVVKRMSWLPLQVLQPVWPMAKNLIEMRYLWSKPHHLDGALFDQLLPGFTPTDPAEALRRAVAPVLAARQDRPKPDGAARPLRQGLQRQRRQRSDPQRAEHS